MLTPKRVRIVLTRHPKKYKKFSVPKQLEFTNASPSKIIQRLRTQGRKKIILVGGTRTNTTFLKNNLIDEMWITIEPKLFGIGHNLIASTKCNVDLQLNQCKKINAQGTLLLHYIVKK